MSTNGLLDKARVEIKLGGYGVAPATALADPSLHPRVQDYRRLTGSRMYPLDKDEIRTKLPPAEYHVSRKIDGEFTVLVYRDGHAYTLNPGGTVRVGMPWEAEAEELLAKAGVKEALVAGELYVARGDEKRPRVHDVVHLARQPESADDLARLRFGVFDILSLDGAAPATFDEAWKQIQRIFGKGERAHSVEATTARDAEQVEKIFHEWVEQQGAEGLVLRSETAGLFKIKPRHTLDVAVVGFTESTDERQGMLHDLLLAVMRSDGALHLLSRVGGGFTEEVRRELLSDLKDMVVPSEYAEVNADHVAYEMVDPQWVIEISCLDLVSQTTRGGPINRMVLNWNRGAKQYETIRRLPLASVISPQFIRRREDKRVEPFDVRIDQVAELVEVPLVDREAGQMTLPKSQMLRREVYTKQLKGATMVRKFAMWKTHKETESEYFPAYVVHYTDFSPNRKDPLSREVRVSSSLEQIDELWNGLKEKNIKAGWNPHGAGAEAGGAAVAEKKAAPKKAAPKKAAPKKKAAAKETKKKAAKKPAKKKAAKKKKG